MRRILFASVFLCASVPFAAAQDPVEVDSAHYKLEFENEHVRVLRITYGPGEKSVMHDHFGGVGVFLTDGQRWRFTFPDGSTQDLEGKFGDVTWVPGGKHLPENTSDTRQESILVEVKSAPAK